MLDQCPFLLLSTHQQMIIISLIAPRLEIHEVTLAEGQCRGMRRSKMLIWDSTSGTYVGRAS